MSEPIGPGDIVECLSSTKLTVGGLYCVERVVAQTLPCDCHGHSPFGLVLRSQPTTQLKAIAWCGLNFKPVKRRDEAFLASLLSDTFIDTLVEA